jgi:hypothetical protein
MAGTALREMQFELFANLGRDSVFDVISELEEEFIAGDH